MIFFIKGNASFNKNVAKSGGAIFLNYTSSNISGNFSLSTNVANYYGGAMFVLS